MSLTLSQFNQMAIADAKNVLQNCVHIPSWIDTLTAQRPFASIEALYRTADQQSQTWTWNEVKQALGQHPRIGQKQAIKTLNEKEQHFSANEQGKLQLNPAVIEALAQGNQAYEAKFGYIFLIRAAGRSSEAILAELQRRLHNSAEQEQVEVSEQLAQIALLRLQQEIIA